MEKAQMQMHRSISLALFTVIAFAGVAVQAQTTAGSGTVMVLPLAANVPVYKTEVFVRNPNSAPITLNVRYYQANDADPPSGLRTCQPLTVAAFQVANFQLVSQCTLGNVDDFGMIILEDAAVPKVNPFFAYSRTQTTGGNGFSVEGFPAGNFSGAPADVVGLKRQAGAPIYRSNCFIGALGEPVSYQMRLWQEGGTPTPIDGTSGPVQGSLAPYEIVRILDIFGSLGSPHGVDAPPGDYFNVRANFSNTAGNNAAFIAFCTLEESTFGGADFRIAKSDDAWDARQQRLACYGQDSCGSSSISVVNPAQITDITRKNIHYVIFDQPDYVQCNLVSPRLADLEIMLRQPGDPLSAPQFTAAPPYSSGGIGQTSFYVFTGDRGAVVGSAGHTTRWYIDVSYRGGGLVTVPINYGFTCRSGNGVTVPWLGTTGPANP
jgi:hypothetical protein